MSDRSEVLVTVNELPDAVNAGAQLLDVRWQLGEQPGAGRRSFLEGHLPGARFLDLERVLTAPLSDPVLGRHPLPDAARLAAGLGALGVDPGRPIIVYDEPGSFAAGRAWWVLRWAGLDVRVLDGGLKSWLAEAGGLASGEAAAVEPTRFELTTGHLPTLDADAVAAFDGVLVDVRAPERFRGEHEPIDPKAGHIPGAVNYPLTGNLEGGRFRSSKDLAELYRDFPDDGIVSCGSGVNAKKKWTAIYQRPHSDYASPTHKNGQHRSSAPLGGPHPLPPPHCAAAGRGAGSRPRGPAQCATRRRREASCRLLLLRLAGPELASGLQKK